MTGTFPPSQRDVNVYVPDIPRACANNTRTIKAVSGSRLMRSLVLGLFSSAPAGHGSGFDAAAAQRQVIVQPWALRNLRLVPATAISLRADQNLHDQDDEQSSSENPSDHVGLHAALVGGGQLWFMPDRLFAAPGRNEGAATAAVKR
jgi:hypothetical protein